MKSINKRGELIAEVSTDMHDEAYHKATIIIRNDYFHDLMDLFEHYLTLLREVENEDIDNEDRLIQGLIEVGTIKSADEYQDWKEEHQE